MNTTTAPALTIADIKAGYQHPGWKHFGYLGERLCKDQAEAADIEAADGWVLAYANAHEWSRDRLFRWLNSREGRQFAEAAFDGNLDRAIGWSLMG